MLSLISNSQKLVPFNYVGRSGVYITKEGLSLAYFSGIEGKENGEYMLNYERLRSLEVKAKCHDASFQGVDILLTTEWPKGDI